ncbi:hypothetical protein ES703_81920 [subsurface metagenome]
MNNLFRIHFENQRISDLLRRIPELLFFLDLYGLDCRDPVALEELESGVMQCLVSWTPIFFVRCNNPVFALAKGKGAVVVDARLRIVR